MVFTTREFLVFFLVGVAGYFVLPHRFRWVFLLGASYVFYAAGEAPYLLLLIAVSILAYGAGLLLESRRDPGQRRVLLFLAVPALLTPLFIYKYLDFVLQSVSDALALTGARWTAPGAELWLPLGISFFTFQALGYVIDVYKGQVRAERHPGRFGLYVAFFPQLIAGPIERARRLLPQFSKVVRFEPEAAVEGGRLMLWGAFKKLVIADSLAVYVDAVYGAPTAYAGLPLVVATLFFAFQIYCDFSGYVDIARGAARVLGIDLMRNFQCPYGAVSVGDFWHRWHISLSTWFRDYLYIPLGGNRRGLALQSRNIAIVFLLSGLWHGANWTFVVWGVLHGLYLLLSLWTADWRRRVADASGLARAPGLHRVLRVAVTFALVSFAWIFFRAASLDDAYYIVTHLFDGLPEQLTDGTTFAKLIAASGGTVAGFWTLVVMTAALLVGHAMPEGTVQRLLDWSARWQRWVAYYALAMGIAFWSVVDVNAFIYFRF
jgi:D-alanyl-lipoteichoic acid acyltransferase DltB (MBOAT superfamily)